MSIAKPMCLGGRFCFANKLIYFCVYSAPPVDNRRGVLYGEGVEAIKRGENQVWVVEQATYMGDGYWADYPPIEFETEKEAREFEQLVNANSQMGGKDKIRRVYFK